MVLAERVVSHATPIVMLRGALNDGNSPFHKISASWRKCILLPSAVKHSVQNGGDAYSRIRVALIWGSAQNLFSCDQAALWMVFSVCLSVRLSVRPSVCPSHLFDYVPITVSSWNFQELSPRTRVTSMQKVKVRGQRSRSQRSQPNLTVSGL